MITGVWLDEADGAQRIAIELGDGDDGLMITDYSYDPPITEDHAALDLTGWVKLAPS